MTRAALALATVVALTGCDNLTIRDASKIVSVVREAAQSQCVAIAKSLIEQGSVEPEEGFILAEQCVRDVRENYEALKPLDAGEGGAASVEE